MIITLLTMFNVKNILLRLLFKNSIKVLYIIKNIFIMKSINFTLDLYFSKKIRVLPPLVEIRGIKTKNRRYGFVSDTFDIFIHKLCFI